MCGCGCIGVGESVGGGRLEATTDLLCCCFPKSSFSGVLQWGRDWNVQATCTHNGLALASFPGHMAWERGYNS